MENNREEKIKEYLLNREEKVDKIEEKIKEYLSKNSNNLYKEYLQFLEDYNLEDNQDNEFDFAGYILERFIQENNIEDDFIEDTTLLFFDFWGHYCF